MIIVKKWTKPILISFYFLLILFWLFPIITSCGWLSDFRMVFQNIFNLLLMIVLFLNPLFSIYVILTNESKGLRILAFLLLFFTALPFLFLGAGHFGSRALDS
jgi:hypothetical protein